MGRLAWGSRWKFARFASLRCISGVLAGTVDIVPDRHETLWERLYWAWNLFPVPLGVFGLVMFGVRWLLDVPVAPGVVALLALGMSVMLSWIAADVDLDMTHSVRDLDGGGPSYPPPPDSSSAGTTTSAPGS